jgi:hypothetical protein
MKKIKVALFEIEYHLGFVQTLVSLINKNKYEISLYTIKSNIDDLKVYLDKDFNKIKIISENNKFKLLYKFFRISKKIKIAFIFSIQDHFLLLPFRFLFFPLCKTVLIAFRPENYTFNFTNQNYTIKQYIVEFVFNFFRYIIAKKSDALITNGEELKKRLKKSHSDKKVIINIPYTLRDFKKKIKKNNNKYFVIGVPGSLSENRRDYFKMLELFEGLKNYKDKFKLVFIGYVNSNTVSKKKVTNNYYINLKNKINHMKKIGFNIKYFNKRLNEKNYQREIDNCDMMYSHLHLGSYEDKGWTGAYCWTISHNKILFTNNTNDRMEFKVIGENYRNDEEFYLKIKKIFSNKKYYFKKNSLNVKKYFSKADWKIIFEKNLNKILSLK